VVADCERHVGQCLSDRFEARLSNGTRVSLGDNGVDQRVADRHTREREAYYRQQDTQAKESRERNEAYLASYSRGLQSNREQFAKATAGVSRLTQLLADNAVTLANAEAACRAAEHAIEAARVEARTEVAEWMAAKKFKRVRLEEGGKPLTRDQTFTYLVETSGPVWGAMKQASPLYEALSNARQSDERWRGDLAEAVSQTIRLPPLITEAEGNVRQFEDSVRSHHAWEAEEQGRRLSYVAPPVIGRALEEARWNNTTTCKRIW